MTTPSMKLGLWLVLLSSVGCASHVHDEAAYAQAARSDPRRFPYVIGVADVVRITVWKDPTLSTDAIVRPDGTITMPLVGELRAAGRTAAELQKEAEPRLAAFVKDAVLTVSIVEVNSYRFTVAGNVEHPGLFNSRSYLTVSEALALAGGPTRYASTSDIVIVRTMQNGTQQRIPIDYDAILSGRAPQQDIVILAGDAVRVP
ncbi:MAG TPA: polysaccharide biosynthesis/export family protein [Polyangiaceae bacterium]